MPNILMIPIDNRPVCYDLPAQIIRQDSSWQFFIPPREFLGGLFSYADYESILLWLKNITEQNKIDYAILSLDTIAYGGLIASRRIEIDLQELKNRVDNFLSILPDEIKIFATSSIMRISNNNINEEEKEYWNLYGKAIFEYSYKFHQTGVEPVHSIPKDILDDYLSTRKRNFDLNKYFLALVKDNVFDYMVISQDDTAQYGLNVKEGNELRQVINQNNLVATIKTGADEIPLSLLGRAFCDFYKKSPSVMPVFSHSSGANVISRYEDVTIENSFLGQINICGAKPCYDEVFADFVLYLNTPVFAQDDLAMQVFSDNSSGAVFSKPKGEFSIADIQSANGAQNGFLEQVLEGNSENLLSYAGWNTTANSLGSVLSASLVRYFANKNNSLNEIAVLKLLSIRLLDDWAYQANLRQKLRQNPNFDLKNAYLEYIKKVEKFLNIKISDFSFYFPWDRTFEIGLEFNIKKGENDVFDL